jgi:hypothetical protein
MNFFIPLPLASTALLFAAFLLMGAIFDADAEERIFVVIAIPLVLFCISVPFWAYGRGSISLSELIGMWVFVIGIILFKGILSSDSYNWVDMVVMFASIGAALVGLGLMYQII